MAPAGMITERSADDDVVLDFNLTLLLLSFASTLSIPVATPGVVLVLLLPLLCGVGLSLLSNKIPAKIAKLLR